MANKPCVVYHWWNDRQMHVWEDWQNPVLVSIASLRAHNSTIPIYVLDVSDRERNWLDYPYKLGFKCIKTDSKIPLINNYEVYGTTYKICSRQFDIDWLASRIPENIILSIESDIFWMGDLDLPEEVDRFSFNFYNSGFYVYNKNSYLSKEFLKVWRHHIVAAMANPNMREKIMKKYDWPYFQDEACLVYIVKTFGGMAAPIDERHNVIFNPFQDWETKYKDVLSLHFIQAIHQKNRGLLPLVVKEFYDVISNVLTPDQLYDIYGPDYRSFAGTNTVDNVKYQNLGLIRRGKDFSLDNIEKLMF